MKSCLICDDHTLLREAIAGAIQLEWPAVATCEAGDFPQAWAACESPHDMIVCDLLMPGATPLDGVAEIRRLVPDTPLIVVTGTEGGRLIMDLYDLGIAGFVPKSAPSSVFIAAIRLVLSGGTYIPREVLAMVPDAALAASEGPHHGKLTARQCDVLRLMAEGQSNKEIARARPLPRNGQDPRRRRLRRIGGNQPHGSGDGSAAGRGDLAQSLLERRIFPAVSVTTS